MTETSLFWISGAFFAIALIYSMVGFGGGSSYLAVLAVSGLAHSSLPPIALVCNLIVATGGFIHFYRGGHFRFKKVLPFTVLSIPMAYWGGSLVVPKNIFLLLLGLSLLFAAIRMLMPGDRFQEAEEVPSSKVWALGLPAGGLLGFLSGLVGIGGGIFLSPLLLFLRWMNVKQAAACSSFFIIANSLSGLCGQWQKGPMDFGALLPLAGAVFLGGQIGSRVGSFHLPKWHFQRVLAVLIISVAVKMLLGIS